MCLQPQKNGYLHSLYLYSIGPLECMLVPLTCEFNHRSLDNLFTVAGTTLSATHFFLAIRPMPYSAHYLIC